MDGILNVYKQPGFTSFDVVAKLRKICGQKKIGHTGTLDPDASGVLPVCLGNATKLCDMLTDKDKEYRAVLYLGRVTDTQDASGKTLKEHPVLLKAGQIRQIILSFVGEYEQLPPMYSALKVNGQKLCDLARAGKEVERMPRTVVIHSIHIEQIALPYVTMTVCCSKGTYIRTLCHDIGQMAGCGGIMESLVRTRSGRFCLQDAYKLSQIEELSQKGQLETILLSTDTMFAHLMAACVKPEAARRADNGNPLLLEHLEWITPKERVFLKEGQQIRLYGKDGCFYGIYSWQEKECRLKPVKLFFTH